MRYGMVIDLKRCIGCQSCTVACKIEHGTPQGVYFNKVLKYEEGSYPNVRMISMPRSCQHCDDAPCVKGCPTGASQQLQNGSVIIDREICMGCRYCMAVCPYEARSFVRNTQTGLPGKSTNYQIVGDEFCQGTVSKCNFCQERISKNREPACVATCPASARVFGDLDDPLSNVSRLIAGKNAKQLYPQAGTNPKVFYIE